MRVIFLITFLMAFCGTTVVPVETRPIPTTTAPIGPVIVPPAPGPGVGPTTAPVAARSSAEDEEVGPLLLIFMLLVMLVVAVVLVAVVAGVLVLAGTLLLMLGILSTSVVVGLARRSAGAAFRTAFALMGAVGMMVIFPLMSSVAAMVILGRVPTWLPVAGGVVGIAAGTVLGYCVAVLLGRVLGKIVEWFRRRRDPTRHVREHFPVEQ